VINGKKNGSWVNYNANGVVRTVINYIDDKKNGLYLKIGLDSKLKNKHFIKMMYWMVCISIISSVTWMNKSNIKTAEKTVGQKNIIYVEEWRRLWN
jgi:hypothetical protein